MGAFYSISHYKSSFLLHSALINILQLPKFRHFATLTDLASNQHEPFNLIEIYLTEHELTNAGPFLNALDKVLMYDQYYSGVIGVLKCNDRSVSYMWREFDLHYNYSQLPTFVSIIVDTLDTVNKTPLEVDVVLYLWPSGPGGLPYLKGPSVRYIIDRHIIIYKGSFGQAIIYNNSLASLYKVKQIKPIIGIIKYPFGMLSVSRIQHIRNYTTSNKMSYRFQGNTHLKFKHTINLMMSGDRAIDLYYLIEYFKKTLQPHIRYQVVLGYFKSTHINNILLWRSITFVNNESGVIDLRNLFLENIKSYANSAREVNVVIYIWRHQHLPIDYDHNIDLYTVIKPPYLTKATVIQKDKLYLYSWNSLLNANINFNDRLPPPPHWYVAFCRRIIREFIIDPLKYILSLFNKWKK